MTIIKLRFSFNFCFCNCPCFAAHNADRFTRSFTGAGVGMGTLPSHGQSLAMADAAITSDTYQPSDILRYFPAQITLKDMASLQDIGKTRDFVSAQFVSAFIGIHIRFFYNGFCL